MDSVVRTIQIPYFSFQRSSTPGLYVEGSPALNRVGGSKRTLGNMNRIVAVSPATVAAAKPIQATVIHFNVERRVTPSTSRSGACAACSACFWTVAISSVSAYQNRGVTLNIRRGGPRSGPGRSPRRLGRQARRLAHAQVRVVPLDLLEQRQTLRVAQQRDRFQRVDHRGLRLLAGQRHAREK